MKRAIIGLALLLAACVPPAPNPIGTTQLYQLRLTYDAAFLVPATNYRRLGLCPGAEVSTFQRVCAERAIVRKLQLADRGAQAAFDQLQAFSLAHPELDAGAYVAAVNGAIAAAVQILAATKGGA